MKIKWCATGLLLFVLCADIQLRAQQAGSGQESIEATKAKAENGDATAQMTLGFYYGQGKGVKQDFAEAVKWYRKAADQGNAIAQINLGISYETGQGIKQDYAEMVKWYRKAADQENGVGELNLGIAYENGRGVPQDYDEAVKWYRKAANQGMAAAQSNLGVCYDNGLGVTQDHAEAVKWHRKAADSGVAEAQSNLAICYENGQGVTQDYVEAVKWYRKAADQGFASAQNNLGICYYTGRGVTQDYAEAVRWYRKSAEQGDASGQNSLGCSYRDGLGVTQEYAEAAKWFRKSAAQGFAPAQTSLGALYSSGQGVTQNFFEAYIWSSLAAAQGIQNAAHNRDFAASHMSREDIIEGQQRAATFVPGKETTSSSDSFSPVNPTASASGFFITDDGYLISNYHVVKEATKVRLVTSAGTIDAKVVRVDAANDLALLKVDGKFSPLPIAASRSAHLGGTVATIGFPDPTLQGFSPKLAKGEIASLSGAGDDPRYFQISVPVQPGNSGGALVDERGNVIGIVSAKLDASVALAASGALPENVNYAVKSSLLLSFLESVPDVDVKLKAPNTADEKFEEVVRSAQNAAVLVLVY